jgi:regulator of sigma D
MHVTQSAHSIQLLQSLRDYFDCGVVKVDNKLTNTMKYQVSSYKDIANKIVPFLDKYPLLTSKYLNYQDLKKAVSLMTNGEHLTSEGMSKIIQQNY